MKTRTLTITGILAAALITSWWSSLPAFGQDAEQPSGSSTSSPFGSPGTRGGRPAGGGGRGAVPGPNLSRFDLSFPGGQPRDLVKAIEKALGRQLNVVIRDEDATVKLPALNLKNVTVVDLFGALEYSSLGGRGGGGFGRTQRDLFTFRTRAGEATDDSIWSFSYQQLSTPSEPKEIRYYNLAPYLESFKIDDITTAVRTGWEMLGDPTGAKFSFHKDTKLLIAVGRAEQLAVIDSALKELSPSTKGQDAPSDFNRRMQEAVRRQQLKEQSEAPGVSK